MSVQLRPQTCPTRRPALFLEHKRREAERDEYDGSPAN